MKARSALAALAAFLLFASACSNKERSEGQKIQVKTLTAKKSPQIIPLESYGSVTYKKKNDVCALVEGAIAEQRVIEGSEVSEGEILFELKNVQYEIQQAERRNHLDSAAAKVRAAKNNLAEEEKSAKSLMMALENARINLMQKKEEHSLLLKNLEKNQRLFEAGGISETSMEQMKMEAKASKAEIDVLEKELQIKALGFEEKDLLLAGMVPSENEEERARQFIELNTKSARIQIEMAEVEKRNAERDLEAVNELMKNLTVRSPCSGIVGALYFEKGERVTQNEKLATVIDMKNPYAKVSVQEKDMERIQLGASAVVEIASASYKTESAVDFISPLADLETGNFYIKIPVDNKERKIRLGMFAKCSIKTKSAGEYFIVPESALVRKDGNTAFLYCVQNDLVYQKECPIEMEAEGKIFIKSGIKDGEKIVEFPSANLKEGLRVKCI
ncbi:MAG: efflux RND transporter periplasmic adaptor subunit [Treponema sp.]|nr:efflux RND transporter periplasmic adaptor subunit [Treponema sp.]